MASLLERMFDLDNTGVFWLLFLLGLVGGIVAWAVSYKRAPDPEDAPIVTPGRSYGSGAYLESKPGRILDIYSPSYGENYISFALSDGTRRRFRIYGPHSMRVGTEGRVTWQGEKLVAFEPASATRAARGPAEPVPTWKRLEAERTSSASGPIYSKTLSAGSSAAGGDVVFCSRCGRKQNFGSGRCISCGDQLVPVEKEPAMPTASFTPKPLSAPVSKPVPAPVVSRPVQNQLQPSSQKPAEKPAEAPKVVCHKCGTEQPYGKGVCVECKAILVRPDNDSPQVFCSQCGRKQPLGNGVCICGADLVQG